MNLLVIGIKVFLTFLIFNVFNVISMAPQVMEGMYNSQADMWAVGVITYILLSGGKPFEADSE